MKRSQGGAVVMQQAERAVGSDSEMEHAEILASIGRCVLASDVDSMMDAVARTTLPSLGEVLVLDVGDDGATAKRLFEFRREPRTWIDGPQRLVGITQPEICTDGHCARISVPLFGGGARIGTLSVASRPPIYGRGEMALVQQIAASVGRALDNIWTRNALQADLEARERLMSVAAHELRGSTWSLRLGVQALRGAVAPLAERGSRLLEIVEREERRLSRMIEELFDLASIQSGQIDLKIETVDLCDVVRDVVNRLAACDRSVGDRARLELPVAAVGRWDRFRVEQVVTNLVTNALKFGAPGEVVIRVGQDGAGQRVRLTVADDGPGIDPAIQAVIFDPFKRDRKLGREGLGLGLYIVRNVVRSLGGNVQVSSVVGEGAMFTVELPRDAGA
jgi:signal transduction histidine kinase